MTLENKLNKKIPKQFKHLPIVKRVSEKNKYHELAKITYWIGEDSYKTKMFFVEGIEPTGRVYSIISNTFSPVLIVFDWINSFKSKEVKWDRNFINIGNIKNYQPLVPKE